MNERIDPFPRLQSFIASDRANKETGILKRVEGRTISHHRPAGDGGFPPATVRHFRTLCSRSAEFVASEATAAKGFRKSTYGGSHGRNCFGELCAQ
jgi:hypothetical protein